MLWTNHQSSPSFGTSVVAVTVAVVVKYSCTLCIYTFILRISLMVFGTDTVTIISHKFFAKHQPGLYFSK